MKIEEEIIRSRQNRTVVSVAKLTDRSEREAERLFRFDGIKLLEEALKNHIGLSAVLLMESRRDAILSRFWEALKETDCRVLTLADDVFLKISEEKSPEGVISIAKYIDKFQKNATIYYSDEKNPESGTEKIVLLESVRDPVNIGAIIRSAAALDVDLLILSADCADIYHPRAVRASMGTLFSQKIVRVTDLAGTVLELRKAGRRVFAATLSEDAAKLGEVLLCGRDCVVIGNEGHGISEEVKNACDRAVIIPMSDRAESFNAAVAASILMWEFSKQ